MESDDQLNDKMKIFSMTDEKLKFLGELLSNESSRSILLMLTKKKMSANDIADKMDLRLSLVIHHLNKMIEAEIVQVTRIGKNTKNHDVKYYSAKSGILIFPEDSAYRAKTSKTLKNVVKRVLRFASIGIVGAFTWVIVSENQAKHLLPENVSIQTDYSIIAALTVIVIGLIVERLVVYIKGKN